MWYSITLNIGILLLAISLFLLKETLVFLKTTERAVGTAIEIIRTGDSDGPRYKPVFSFKTNTNQEVTYRHIVASSPPGWQIGDKATIAYNANNPSVARLLTYFGVFHWSIVLMAIAMPLLVIGGGYYLSQWVLK